MSRIKYEFTCLALPRTAHFFINPLIEVVEDAEDTVHVDYGFALDDVPPYSIEVPLRYAVDNQTRISQLKLSLRFMDALKEVAEELAGKPSRKDGEAAVRDFFFSYVIG